MTLTLVATAWLLGAVVLAAFSMQVALRAVLVGRFLIADLLEFPESQRCAGRARGEERGNLVSLAAHRASRFAAPTVDRQAAA